MTLTPSRTPPTTRTRVRAARGTRTRAPVLIFAVAALALSVAGATTIGTADLTVTDVFRTHGVHLGLPLEPLPALADSIVWNLRTPRVLLAGLVGGGLAVCGAVLQALTRNPLADPYLLGISAGASTGAVSVLVLGLGVGAGALTGGAFAGAVAAFLATLALAGRRWTEPSRILLAGVAVGQLFAAVTSLIVVSAASPQQTRGVTFWLLGSLTMAGWSTVALAAAVAAGALLICWAATPALDAFAFGTDVAQSLGFSPVIVRALLFGTTALLAAVLVAASGAIGFVGLTVPHAARYLVGSRHRILLPTCAVIGATFLIWADTAARTVFTPQEVPVGVVTALLGVPAFALLIRRRQVPA
ncbi:iron chelate uptake ABC transporter family permease subunit [Solwaraspora sp. WMMA2080]|uniref:FecCD family ABC transporter permease n=1 Tax=unclassified Solwaraspora TaxID=2627926 RepID=UPI00248CC965|nr:MULTISPECIES: iron chelate uptake ABC transporter family permease subunit [unclassified Solwaraspora]WBB96518.1 iron chelate uptake ABC transporter family permease subunit [Solwaraspora sp. WMMA2059]WBC19577.1 iron chelate uptake ABC transporter family permease subunit [Solwaraspora sp. WMMA2080]